jgi:Tfp pilus assembly pilus retraction ATPase PilT
MNEEQHDILIKSKNLDFSFTFSNRRFRVNISFQLSNYMIVLRLLTADIPSIEKLNLPTIYKDITKL